MSHRLVTACIVLIAGVGLPSGAAPSHPIEAEDHFSLATATGLAVSPSGDMVAWSERRWEPPAERPGTGLWVMDLGSRSSERLTFEPAEIAGMEFSRDGRWIYFGSKDADDVTQVWRIAAEGGIAQAVTRSEDGIEQWDLAADDRTLVYTVAVDDPADQWQPLRDEFPDLEYGRGKATHSAVRVLDLVTWRTRSLDAARRVILELEVSRDGRFAALVTSPDNETVYREGWSSVEVLDLASGTRVAITGDGWRDRHPSPFGWVDRVRLADDGDALTFTVSFDGYPTLLYAAERAADGWHLAELARPAGVSVVGGSSGWRPHSRDLVFRGDVQARVQLYAIPGVRAATATAAARPLTRGDVVVDAWDWDGDGTRLVVVSGSPTSFGDLYQVGGGGELTRVTDLNPQVADWILPTIELVRWTAPDGREVEGVLELPPGWTPAAGPLPLIVQIHGGPTAASHYCRQFRIYGHTLMPATGYALLSPNYRGSTGYGDDFMTELVGRENEIDVQDILTGVDAMVARGVADPARLGVMGWSNGGFLTNALIAAGDRFKAASSGAGVLDQVVQWATEDTPGHVVNFMGSALPWDDPAHYVRSSPLYGLGDASTPTVIHVGGSDPRVPQAHSRGLYRALSIYLGVPAELVVYPGAEHSLKTYTHQRAKMAWDLAWFERFLGPGWKPGADGH